MLKKMILKNFKTFKEETIIDFEATKFKGIVKNNVYDGIVKGGVFLGSNGAGKTTILEAIKLLLEMLFRNQEVDLQSYVCYFGDSIESELTYEFMINRKCIKYSFVFNMEEVILKEQLYLENNLIIDRSCDKAKLFMRNDTKEYNSNDFDKSILFLKKYYFVDKFSGNKDLREWMSFLENSIYFNSYNRQDTIYNYNKAIGLKYYEDINNVNNVNKFLNDYGFAEQIKYESNAKINNHYSVYLKDKKIVLFKKDSLDCWIPIDLESEGNVTLAHMLPVILHAISTNCIILFDEFSSGFSNELEEFVIKFLMDNMECSQVFIVTHSTNVLKSTLLRPDQIYNVIFNGKNGSSIVRASNESPRETQNYEKMYLGGVFGGRIKYGRNKDQ